MPNRQGTYQGNKRIILDIVVSRVYGSRIEHWWLDPSSMLISKTCSNRHAHVLVVH